MWPYLLPGETSVLWNSSIFSRWLDRRQISRAWGGGRSPYIVGRTRPHSVPLWVTCACLVPGVTSLRMPEPGKKPGSFRTRVGSKCESRGVSTIGEQG